MEFRSELFVQISGFLQLPRILKSQPEVNTGEIVQKFKKIMGKKSS